VHTGRNPLEGLTVRKSGTYSVSLFQWIADVLRAAGWLPRKSSIRAPLPLLVGVKNHDRRILADFQIQDMQIICAHRHAHTNNVQ
jgi:hypothetical protein